ncbi:type II secretion system F family protein [Massilia sp. CF038]|uniref:type II secretion system F family protein n=1 Tax=Massilia sp. CF038 TaxID=1881045 RepID=UPI000913FE69|nr:type II secretion system F family protein [Massilia sp. CF038]SHG50322.1 tight adherence protein C [Massilia sp. CF038]
MSILQIGFLSLVFFAVLGGAFGVMRMATRTAVQGRIAALSGDSGAAAGPQHTPLIEHIARITSPLAKLSLPEDNWERSSIRTRFIMAGLRHPSAPAIFFAAKTAFALLLPALAYVLATTGEAPDTTTLLLYLLGAATFGTYLPNLLLRNAIARRQNEIFESFPDALDLMTICVEAGLGVDAALSRVAGEIGLSSRILSEELTLVTLELRAGGTKEKALRNLALRTGVEDVDALVSMLIQAERFGTSIAASLRIQSDLLRTKRRMRAEETAAKIGLKLLFPLIFFIFPALLVVLMGPAMLQIYRVLLPTMAQQ